MAFFKGSNQRSKKDVGQNIDLYIHVITNASSDCISNIITIIYQQSYSIQRQRKFPNTSYFVKPRSLYLYSARRCSIYKKCVVALSTHYIVSFPSLSRSLVNETFTHSFFTIFIPLDKHEICILISTSLHSTWNHIPYATSTYGWLVLHTQTRIF